MLLTFDGADYELRPGESVLEGMARHGVGIPSACLAGSCHACVVRSVTGDPGPDARRGLKATWLAAGYFLACQARPASDLAVAVAGDDTRTPARLTCVSEAGPGVLLVRVRPERPADFRPGQHVALATPAGVARIYSIANLPAEAATAGLEFHVRVHPGGAMSGWLARARPGAALIVGSAAGECFYLPGDTEGPLLLAGTGTGIAPLVAIARQALAQGHRGPVTVLHGSAEPAGLYLGTDCPAALADLSARGATPRWRTCARSLGQDIADGAVAELAGLRDRSPGRPRAYLCGGPGSVRRMRRALFLAGLSLGDILSDQFTPAAC
jgi:NAD(P)H-flavin reductase